MKRILSGLAVIGLLLNTSFAGELVNVDEETGLALQGYDPVAFFTEGRAVKGSPDDAVQSGEATYLFSSKEHMKAFQADPERYEPAFGGYCAFGASVGKVFPVEIDTWQIQFGRLFFQKDQEIKKMFDQNPEENFRKAEANWPKLVEQHGK